MELGALVCTPKTPDCAACPVRGRCAAVEQGLDPARLPVKQPRAARRPVAIACALVERAGRVLLVRRKAGELLAGTWALPAATVGAGVPAVDAARAAAVACGVISAAPPIHRGQVRHVFTHRDLTADVFSVADVAPQDRRAATADTDRRWVDRRELATLGISSFTRKTLAAGLVTPPARARRRAKTRERA